MTNVVRYAWPAGGSHTLDVRLSRNDSFLELDVSDDGVPFDPTAARSDPLPDRITDWPDGGRGLRLLQRMVDSLEYRRDGRCNRVRARIAL